MSTEFVTHEHRSKYSTIEILLYHYSHSLIKDKNDSTKQMQSKCESNCTIDISLILGNRANHVTLAKLSKKKKK